MLIIDRDNFLWKMNLVKTKKKTKKRQYTRNMYSNLSKKKKDVDICVENIEKTFPKKKKTKRMNILLTFCVCIKIIFI